MMMEKKLNALADEELENVNGGAGEVNYDTNFAAGDEFSSSLYPGETCKVVFVMPGGLCYTVGSSTATYTNPLYVLQPTKVYD